MQATPTSDLVHKGSDDLFMNSCMFLHDALLYWTLALVMQYGAIGLVEDTVTYWIPIFKSTQKHKYAAHMNGFLTHLQALPPCLAWAIQLNWMCNPGGCCDGFHAVDWLIELNNLYTKVDIQSGGDHQHTHM